MYPPPTRPVTCRLRSGRGEGRTLYYDVATDSCVNMCSGAFALPSLRPFASAVCVGGASRSSQILDCSKIQFRDDALGAEEISGRLFFGAATSNHNVWRIRGFALAPETERSNLSGAMDAEAATGWEFYTFLPLVTTEPKTPQDPEHRRACTSTHLTSTPAPHRREERESSRDFYTRCN